MTFDDEITAALRRDLQAAHVGFDAGGAEAMIRVATQSDPLGERRAYAAPLAAAAAVVVIGGGVATFAATRDSGTPTGGGPVAPAPCATTSTSAGASVIPPPIHTAPASAFPAAPSTTVPALPVAAPSTTAVEPPAPSVTVPPLPTAVPSTTAAEPPALSAPAEPRSSSAVLAPPEATLSARDLPTPVPSTSPTDDPCATSATPTATASDQPTAVPSTPRPLPAASCSPLDPDPGFSGCITFFVQAKSAPGTPPRSVTIPNVTGIPSSARYAVSGYVVRNSGAASGTVTITQGNTVVARHRFLAGSTSAVLSVDSPTVVSGQRPAVVQVSCDSAATVCSATVSIAARPMDPSFAPTAVTAYPTPSATRP